MIREELQNYKYALRHLEANPIDDPDRWDGWYSGKKSDFIKRHQKSLTMFRKIIKEAENA